MGRPKGNLAWRDSSNVERKKPDKKKQASKKAVNVAPPVKDYEGPIPFELLQLLLNIFKNSFAQLLESDFAPLLQEVKQHLFNRDFAQAFGRQDYLEVYAARWSSSRALGYLEIFEYISKHAFKSNKHDGGDSRASYKAVCFGGGGGAEVTALGGFLDFLSRQSGVRVGSALPDQTTEASNRPRVMNFDVHCVDIANWGPVADSLYTSMLSTPPIYKYASAAAKTANKPLLETSSFHVTSHQQDLLDLDVPALSILLQDANLVTLMFTLNELYSTSLSKTQALLLKMTACIKKGAYLLVVDSPGSYSTISLNGSEKNYPMQWLLDHTLLRKAALEDPASWEKLESDESRWFRLPQGLKYPIELENMRYQLHLFQKLD
ncbi:uncharacterized protein BDZ99DRAFT_98331 [Mytilinidion resinicola]|uniref:25S rRNA (Uridine(2843)-N(3))-methyltransferase n=1 Tax=Mytilinidion resinicola TaxID=574789 RepID=A0A6A6YCM5_9PEZI|nr:uncharacterized protein BDZ99DRAFT_98331 [Mytilinidion resinicola]KAF2806586.1 hypothetical protein BDZ99DRAFT_98331 [Mytilinidion resinicola]